MPRLKRKSIEFNEESLRELVQETYNDAHQIRSTIIALFNNWNTKVKELGEVAAVGKEVVNLINALSRNQDQKIALLKVLTDIIYGKDKKNSGAAGSTTSSSNEGTDTPILSEQAKNDLRKMIEEARERGDINI